MAYNNPIKDRFNSNLNSIVNFTSNTINKAKTNLESGQGLLGSIEPKVTPPTIPPPVVPPVKNPVPVQGSQQAINQSKEAQTAIDENDYYKKGIAALDAQTQPTDRVMRGSGTKNPNYVEPVAPVTTPKTEEKKTPEDLQVDAIQYPDGEIKQFNIETGQESMQKPGTPNFTTTNPNEVGKSYTEEVQTQTGVNIRKIKNEDGTDSYINWNSKNNTYAGLADASQFSEAKRLNTIRNNIADLQSGIYNPEQKAQLNNIERDFQRQIDLQNDLNDDWSKGVIGSRTFSGGGFIQDKTALTTAVDKGIEHIASLYSAKESAIAAMKQSFLTNNTDQLKDAYATFREVQKGIQDGIAEVKKTLDASKAKTEQIKKEMEVSKIYDSGITDPIKIYEELAKKGITMTTEEIGSTLSTIEKASVDAEKKQTDVWNAAQAVGDYKTASQIMALDPRSPTFNEDLKKLQGSLKAKATQAEKDSYMISNTSSMFDKMTGPDGYVDPYEYRQMRASSQMSPTEFDNRFAHYVNPASNDIVGFKETKETPFGSPTAADKSDVMSLLGKQKKEVRDTIDMDRLESDPTYFYWVKAQLE